MIVLKSDRLRVDLLEPEECVNNMRFDHAGSISEVVLDNSMFFCASEPRNLRHPSSGGRGLCSEFRFDVSAQAEIGECFPKFGVGLIRKEADEPYIFHKKYENVQLFPVQVQHSGTTAVYITEPLLCLGYGMRSTKTISVLDNTITMSVKVENTGEKEIELDEYCHNFISIGGMAIGPSYRLELPDSYCPDSEWLKNHKGEPSNFCGTGNGVSFCEYIAAASAIHVASKGTDDTIPFSWKLINDSAKACVEAKDYFVPSSIMIWSADHMVSPEIFHRFSISPGQSHEWVRTWKFEMF